MVWDKDFVNSLQLATYLNHVVKTDDLFDSIDKYNTIYQNFVVFDDGIDDAALEKSLTDLILATPRTATPAFFNQLFGGRNDKAVLGDMLSVFMNNSMATYKAAGPQIAVEKAIIDVCGWQVICDRATLLIRHLFRNDPTKHIEARIERTIT